MSSSRALRALITNDDGIDSPGLWALASGARDAGFDVVVAAPHVDASGVGASVVSVREGNRTRVHPREIPGLAGVPAFAVEGHPAWIVHAAARGWLDPVPDVVLSGANLGANVGRMVLHSGTVGAALTASLYGWRALAVSLDADLLPLKQHSDTSWNPPEKPHWEAVRHVLPAVLDLLLAGQDGTVLSLNVPDLPVADLGLLREATLAPFGAVQIHMEHRTGDDGEALHSSPVEMQDGPAPGTDIALLAAGHPTLTALQSVAARPGILDGLHMSAIMTWWWRLSPV